jgi:hypothetical protein
LKAPVQHFSEERKKTDEHNGLCVEKFQTFPFLKAFKYFWVEVGIFSAQCFFMPLVILVSSIT